MCVVWVNSYLLVFLLTRKEKRYKKINLDSILFITSVVQ